MGTILTLLNKICGTTNSICNSNLFSFKSSCCGQGNRDQDVGINMDRSPAKYDKHSPNRHSHSPKESPSDSEDLIYDDYYIMNAPLLKHYYCPKNLASFACDVNGVTTQCGDNMEDFVGISREKNLQTINWVANIPKNNYHEYSQWTAAVKNRKHYIKKMHFSYTRDDVKIHRYVIVESIPMYSDEGDYMGVRGIVLKVPHKIWQVFEDNSGSEPNELRSPCSLNSAIRSPCSACSAFSFTPPSSPRVIPSSPRVIPSSPRVIPSSPRIPRRPPTPLRIPSAPPAPPRIPPRIPLTLEIP